MSLSARGVRKSAWRLVLTAMKISVWCIVLYAGRQRFAILFLWSFRLRIVGLRNRFEKPGAENLALVDLLIHFIDLAGSENAVVALSVDLDLPDIGFEFDLQEPP